MRRAAAAGSWPAAALLVLAAWSAAGFLLLGFASTFYLGSRKTKTKQRSGKRR
jgi:hypothetical protein